MVNVMIPERVNNLSTLNVDLRIVAEHAQTVKYNLSTGVISTRYTGPTLKSAQVGLLLKRCVNVDQAEPC